MFETIYFLRSTFRRSLCWTFPWRNLLFAMESKYFSQDTSTFFFFSRIHLYPITYFNKILTRVWIFQEHLLQIIHKVSPVSIHITIKYQLHYGLSLCTPVWSYQVVMLNFFTEMCLSHQHYCNCHQHNHKNLFYYA